MTRLLSAPLATLATLGLLATLAAPAEAAKRRPPPSVVEDALAFAESDRAKAIQLLEAAIDDVGSRDVDVVTVHLAEQQRLAGNHDAAHELFTSVFQRTRKGADHEAARLGASLVQAANNLDAAVVDVLEDVNDKDALATQNADRYLALALYAAKHGGRNQVRIHGGS